MGILSAEFLSKSSLNLIAFLKWLAHICWGILLQYFTLITILKYSVSFFVLHQIILVPLLTAAALISAL